MNEFKNVMNEFIRCESQVKEIIRTLQEEWDAAAGIADEAERRKAQKAVFKRQDILMKIIQDMRKMTKEIIDNE